MAERSIGVGLVGLGVVGGQVARVLLGKSGILEEQAGCPVVLRRVKVLDVDLSRPQAQEMPHQLLTTDEDNFFTTAGIDIIVEAIGGEEPARRYLERALGAGKHVVTANKEVIAKYGTELITLAQRQQVSLNYEAAVGGGIPLIAPFQRDLVANDIKGIYSIINGTTNYILTRMSREGTDFATALDQAQEPGSAEDDPGNDIDGIDAAYKLAILASLAFQSRIRPDEIFCEGIIKLLSIAKKTNNSIEARVHPVFIPEDYFLAKVDGVYNAVLVEGDLCGQITFLGKGAGALPTASAIVADVVRAARDIVYGVGAQTVWKVQPDRFIKPMPDVITRYYIRMNIADSAGVLAQIAGLLGEGNISISSAIQKEADEKTRTAEIVIMTHPAQEKAMQRAMEKLGRLEAVKEISTFVRVED
jgi:homoserine dehydrogenase